MDVLKKFSFDLPGICGNIKEYTSEPYIIGIITELREAFKQNRLEDTIYLLGIVKDWYRANQPAIQSNSYVFNKKVHRDLEQKIITYISELDEYQKSVSDNESGDILEMRSSKIFISHSSKDKVICDAFVELLEDIGLPEGTILYTSLARHGIPGDNNIFNYLRQHISEKIIVYFMLSDNYYKSVYCLNEMGAAWLAQNDYSIFLLPSFIGKIEGVIDNRKKGYSLNEPFDLITLKNKLVSVYDLELSETKWEDIKNKFLKVIEKL